MADYYLKYNDRISGPFPVETLKAMARDGLVTAVHTLSTDKEHWLPAEQIPGLFDTPPSNTDSASSAHPTGANPNAPGMEANTSGATGPWEQPSAPWRPIPDFEQVAGKAGAFQHAESKIDTKPATAVCLISLALLLVTLVVAIVTQDTMTTVGERLSMGHYINPANYMQGLEDEGRIRNLSTVGSVLSVLVGLATLVYIVTWLIPLYQCWNRVQPLKAENPDVPGPLMATGFLLIPFYNFYWIFHSLVALGKYLALMANRIDPSYPPAENPVVRGLAITNGVVYALAALVGFVAGGSALMLFISGVQLLCSLFYLRAVVKVANRLA